MTCARGCCETQAAHYRGITLTMPTAAGIAVKREDADLAAYARLRRSGVQPPSHVGAAALESCAEVPQEVAQGALIRHPRLRREVQAAIDSSPPPAVTAKDT